ncbi:MAG: universal stress protein [Acidobacteriia bacterium]|nr:universal stress protein [Terriglobia bacterium]
MLPFRRVLFPVDFSEACQTITPHVKDMVRHWSAELILVHAFELPPLYYYGELGYASGVNPIVIPEAELRTMQKRRIREFDAQHFSGLNARRIVEKGDPAAVIQETATQERIDLVMMPTRGHGTFRRLLLGSVTSKVLHDVNCAVWTDAHATLPEHTPRVPYQSILCALDLSDEAPAVLKAAASIASSYGAKLHIIHSIERVPGVYDVDFEPYRKKLVDAARDRLQEIKRDLGVAAAITVLSEGIDLELRREAGERKGDLLVLGRGHVQGMFRNLRSRLYSIIRESPCPVLSI